MPGSPSVLTEVVHDTVITVVQCGTCEAVRMLELEIMMIVRDVPKK